jgi:hypothetical protein
MATEHGVNEKAMLAMSLRRRNRTISQIPCPRKPDTPHDLLFEIGARVSYHARIWYVHVASAFPLAHHYRSVLAWGA